MLDEILELISRKIKVVVVILVRQALAEGGLRPPRLVGWKVEAGKGEQMNRFT